MLVLIYAGNNIITGSNSYRITSLVHHLRKGFSLNDQGDLHNFLGIEMILNKDDLFLNQSRYAIDLLERVSMRDCKSISTPLPKKYNLYKQMRI